MVFALMGFVVQLHVQIMNVVMDMIYVEMLVIQFVLVEVVPLNNVVFLIVVILSLHVLQEEQRNLILKRFLV